MFEKKQTEHIRILNKLKKDIGEIHGEPILKRFRRWQTVESPTISMEQEHYNPKWERYYNIELSNISAALKEININYYHIGSTSVPGLDSKPVIDIAIQLNDVTMLKRAIQLLPFAGYKNWGGSPVHPDTTWHWHIHSTPVYKVVHLCLPGNPWIPAAINFRDYLRTFPKKRIEYMTLKRKLSKENNNDLALYSIKKASLLYRLNKEANQWRNLDNCVY